MPTAATKKKKKVERNFSSRHHFSANIKRFFFLFPLFCFHHTHTHAHITLKAAAEEKKLMECQSRGDLQYNHFSSFFHPRHSFISITVKWNR
jgi:hypothetical protein